MAYRDILLHVFTYPDIPPEPVMRTAATIAGRLGAASDGEVTALMLEVRIRTVRNRLANLLAGIDDLVQEENAASIERARIAGLIWEEVALERGLKSRVTVVPADLFGETGVLVEAARTRDICLIPVGSGEPAAAEAVLFGSGRPVMIFPEAADVGQAAAFERIAVAWDGTRAAARALADALPLLKTARDVRVLTVLGDKPAATEGLGGEVVRHLARHGVTAGIDEIRAAGRPIGKVLEDHVAGTADLLVMGGFGHSRARDFLLGGATQSILRQPPAPVFLSH
jgi:nucleotide-binding universal stress UspA family protein